MSRTPVALMRREMDDATLRWNRNSDARLAELKEIRKNGQQIGVIALVDGPLKGDPPDTACAVICSVADKSIIRCALTKQRALNLSRVLVEAVK